MLKRLNWKLVTCLSSYPYGSNENESLSSFKKSVTKIKCFSKDVQLSMMFKCFNNAITRGDGNFIGLNILS